MRKFRPAKQGKEFHKGTANVMPVFAQKSRFAGLLRPNFEEFRREAPQKCAKIRESFVLPTGQTKTLEEHTQRNSEQTKKMMPERGPQAGG